MNETAAASPTSVSVPVSTLGTKAQHLVSAIESRGQSTVITRDGRAVAVLVSVSEYQRMEEEAWAGRMLRELPEALADVKRGDGIPHEQVARELAARYARLSSR